MVRSPRQPRGNGVFGLGNVRTPSSRPSGFLPTTSHTLHHGHGGRQADAPRRAPSRASGEGHWPGVFERELWARCDLVRFLRVHADNPAPRRRLPAAAPTAAQTARRERRTSASLWCEANARVSVGGVKAQEEVMNSSQTTTLYAERPEAFGKPTPKAKPPARKPPPAVSHNAVPWQMKRVGGGYRENPNAELSNAYSTIDRLVAENAKLSAALQSCSGEKAALAASIAASEAALRHAHLREGATSKTLQAAQAELAEKATNWESLLSSRSSKLRGLEEARTRSASTSTARASARPSAARGSRGAHRPRRSRAAARVGGGEARHRRRRGRARALARGAERSEAEKSRAARLSQDSEHRGALRQLADARRSSSASSAASAVRTRRARRRSPRTRSGRRTTCGVSAMEEKLATAEAAAADARRDAEERVVVFALEDNARTQHEAAVAAAAEAAAARAEAARLKAELPALQHAAEAAAQLEPLAARLEAERRRAEAAEARVVAEKEETSTLLSRVQRLSAESSAAKERADYSERAAMEALLWSSARGARRRRRRRARPRRRVATRGGRSGAPRGPTPRRRTARRPRAQRRPSRLPRPRRRAFHRPLDEHSALLRRKELLSRLLGGGGGLVDDDGLVGLLAATTTAARRPCWARAREGGASSRAAAERTAAAAAAATAAHTARRPRAAAGRRHSPRRSSVADAHAAEYGYL